MGDIKTQGAALWRLAATVHDHVPELVAKVEEFLRGVP